MRYELTDGEWAAIKPLLPNKPRGVAIITALTLALQLSPKRVGAKIN